MYGIFIYIYHKTSILNVGYFSIHGACGKKAGQFLQLHGNSSSFLGFRRTTPERETTEGVPCQGVRHVVTAAAQRSAMARTDFYQKQRMQYSLGLSWTPAEISSTLSIILFTCR